LEMEMKCDICSCGVDSTFHFARVESRRLVSEDRLCELHTRAFISDFLSQVWAGSGESSGARGLVKVDFEMIAYHNGPEDTPACVYLHEVGGARRLCIKTNGWAWWALMAQIRQDPAPRPRTHVAWAATIAALGGELQDVLLDMREGENWWRANLRIVKEGRVTTLDVRPSDGYILAVTRGVPIFVVEVALEMFAEKEGTGDRKGDISDLD
jgi:bifunctional DNase/RNase